MKKTAKPKKKASALKTALEAVKVLADAAPTLVAVPRGTAVETVEVKEPSWFVTLDRDDPVWTAAKVGKWKRGQATFARLRPPVDVPEERLAEVRDGLRAAGAAVVVERAQRAAVVVTAPEVTPISSAREVVTELVEAANTKDRDALRARVEETMSSVGI